MPLLTTLLLVFCLWLLLRLRTTRRIVRELLEASEAGRPVLIEQRGGIISGYRLDRLMETFNRLMAEKAAITDSGQEYFERIRTTLGNLREAVVMVDRHSAIRLANPAFREMVRPEGDPIGNRLDLFIQGEGFHEFLREVRTGGTGQRKELAVQVNDERRWLEISAAPMLDARRSSADPYTLFVFHDITRQKRLEKMRTEFVANVSHELRTPVTVIKGFAETLIEDETILSPEERVRFLKKIRANSERLHSLLQDLVLLSRLESTEMVLQLEDLSLSAFIGDLLETWDTVLEEGSQRLVTDFATGNDRVRADPLRLTQVVNNLMDNVVRHARGFTEIRIRTRLEEEGVRLTIEDDGSGIPEKDLPHIFQRFYRVDKGRSRESGGTGLGLSIVKHIIVQHGGDVIARSRKGEGTAIDVILPPADRQDDSPPSGTERNQEDPGNRTGSQRAMEHPG